MSHLLKFRKGWQSEHLAKYIISKFAFIAEPTNISDDIGSDFFCTLFLIKERKYLLPQSSFAIQIKSNRRKIDITKKLDYFINIEIPFFIGVINRKQQKLTIYSGESFPFFFSHYGNPSTLKSKPKTFINLVDERNNHHQYLKSKNGYILFFPSVLEIDITFDYEKNNELISPLLSILPIYQKNISARKSCEYIFNFVESDDVKIFAGSGSAKTYKDNFYKRLSEAFFNLEWRYQKEGKYIKDEFDIYEQDYLKLNKLFGPLPHYLTSIYGSIKSKMQS
jgi:hypothetical protein